MNPPGAFYFPLFCKVLTALNLALHAVIFLLLRSR